MSEVNELLLLRLGLLAVVLLFILVVAITLRAPIVRAAAAPRAQSSPILMLVVAGDTGLQPGTAFSLGGELTIGRDETNGIVLDDESVSRQHALVRVTSRGAEVADLGSSNGTLVNGRLIEQRVRRLRDGDEVRLGIVTFEYHA